MQVDTGQFMALTAEAAEAEFLRRQLTEADARAARLRTVEEVWEEARRAERDAAMRPGRRARPRGARRGHLKLVSGGAR